MSATARGRDGLVEVTVGADSRLHLDERTRQHAAPQAARTIMDTVQAAKDDLVRQSEAATAIGAHSRIGRMLIEALRRRLGPPVDSSGKR